jgi:AraC-like DNA-binding protein
MLLPEVAWGSVWLTTARTCVGAAMDGATLSPYPHYSWLAHWIVIRPPCVFALFEDRYVTHRLLLTTSGDARIAWNAQAGDLLFQSTVGDVGFYPRDDTTHRMAITASAGYHAYAILLPDKDVRDIHVSDGLRPVNEAHATPVFRDAVLQACLLRLARGSGCRHVSEDIGDEIAARQIVIRLSVIVGGRPPDWTKDRSVFTPCVMWQVVERLDAFLALHASLEQVSSGFGLSPSHFARKFHQSTGLSLNRFMNRRRVGLALVLLRTARTPLAQVSLDLGFCSQSHFTRVFRGLTGMTPHVFSRGRDPAEA